MKYLYQRTLGLLELLMNKYSIQNEVLYNMGVMVRNLVNISSGGGISFAVEAMHFADIGIYTCFSS